MKAISEQQRFLGRHIREQFGPNTSVFGYGDDSGEYEIDLVSGLDCPDRGVTSYGTIGLYRYTVEVGTQSVNVELLGACDSGVAQFDNFITSCAFERMKNGSPLAYGAVMENILAQYDISRTLKHATFVAPFLWGGFSARTFSDLTIHWLMVLPISDGELEYLRSNGIDALEDRFEQAQIDIFDIDRPSIL